MLIETIKLWPDREDVALTAFVNSVKPPFSYGRRPAVIVCPGGAYETCDRHSDEGDPVAMTFAADGYQAFVLEYSITSKAPEGKTVYPAMFLDYGKAILTIREHAEEWNVDIDNISIIGFSAGGHLCGMIATSWNNGILSEYFDVDAKIFKPLCAMLIYPVADFMAQEEFIKVMEKREENTTPVESVTSKLFSAWFGKIKPTEEELIAESPAHIIAEDCPPVFLVGAQNDCMIDPCCTLNMALALQNANVPYELHMYEYGDHGFGLGRYISEPWREDKKYTASAWVRAAKAFLLHQYAPETADLERKPFAQFDFSEF